MTPTKRYLYGIMAGMYVLSVCVRVSAPAQAQSLPAPEPEYPATQTASVISVAPSSSSRAPEVKVGAFFFCNALPRVAPMNFAQDPAVIDLNRPGECFDLVPGAVAAQSTLAVVYAQTDTEITTIPLQEQWFPVTYHQPSGTADSIPLIPTPPIMGFVVVSMGVGMMGAMRRRILQQGSSLSAPALSHLCMLRC